MVAVLLTLPQVLGVALTPQLLDLGRGRSMQLLIPAAETDQLDAAAQIMGLDPGEIAAQLAALRDSAGDAAVPTSARMAAVVWPASHSFASMLTHCPSFVQGSRVLEIGCGLGTVGIAAAMAGAKSVLLTDTDAASLEAAQASANLNGVGPVVSTAEIDICNYDAAELAAFGPFDLVLGSDILFNGELTPRVAALIAEVFGARQAETLAGSAPRAMLADPEARAFRPLLEATSSAQGLVCGEMPLPQILPGLERCVLMNVMPEEA